MLVESSKISEMQHWYQALPGSMLHTIEMRHLNRYLPRLYGQFALQIGGLESLVMLERSPIPNKIFLFESFCSNTLGHNLKADLTQLPLAPNSLDLMLLPHVLEFCDDPKQLLSQCYQALAPFGHLLILSFLPLSLWGLWRLGNRCQGIPWSGNFIKQQELHYWVDAIGFSIMKTERLCCHWPTKRTSLAKLAQPLDIASHFFGNHWGSISLMIVQKQINTMTPIKASWWSRKTPPPIGCAKSSIHRYNHVASDEKSGTLL